jgi:hypothetical protein
MAKYADQSINIPKSAVSIGANTFCSNLNTSVRPSNNRKDIVNTSENPH